MDDYKEFTGKTLDEAMAAACDYFGLGRGKLEIEILSDAKSGIFGLVGAKKAAVRARKANIEGVHLKMNAQRHEGAKQEPPRSEKNTPRPAAPATEETPAAPQAELETPAKKEPPAKPRREKPVKKGGQREGATEDKNRENKNKGKNRAEQAPEPRRERPPRPRREKPAAPQVKPEALEERFPEVPLETMDQELLKSEVLTVVDFLSRHIVGETGKECEISGGKARVRIDSGENSGLLIGRDGQTLSSLQYLASCIVSRRVNATVRVQIDAGDYRSRQLEKLRAITLEMAARVKETSRPQSTRPMSAYLRRIVHMTLQEDPDVQTHSKGEGNLKRVVIVPKKK